MTNNNVCLQWSLGEKGNSNNMSTDGDNIYSYNMKIGETQEGKKVALDVQSPNFYSNTTSQHVGLVKRYADHTLQPVRIKNGYSYWYVFP